MPGIYCSGVYPTGERCQRKLATSVGGLFVLAFDKYAAIVGQVQAIHCPDCGTDNTVEPAITHAAVIIEYGSTVNTAAAS